MTVVKRVVAATLLGGAVASSLLGAGVAAALPGDQGGDGTGWVVLYNGVPGCMHVGEQIPVGTIVTSTNPGGISPAC